jgi:short-subunit dehydrogenase
VTSATIPGPRIALITGATAGIGAEFAHQLAERKYNLVLVARDTERLEALAAKLITRWGVVVEVLPADLATVKGRTAVEKRAAAAKNPIDLLVNNAGFGLKKPFEVNSLADEQRLLDLLVTVPMRLSHAALQQMLPRATGTIINIASVAAFTPRGTYGASKAWVVSFSRWANLTYKKRGVTVTGVAPGFVRTEMHERMGVRTDNIPNFMWLTTERLVLDALKAAERGKAVVIPSLRYKVLTGITRALPARVVASTNFKRD